MFTPATIDRIQRGVLGTWTLWMTWFCWFFGAQVMLLWIRPEWLDGEGTRLVVAGAWMVYNASGIVIALLVARFSWEVRRIKDLGFPARSAATGAVLNAVALCGNCWLWWKIYDR